MAKSILTKAFYLYRELLHEGYGWEEAGDLVTAHEDDLAVLQKQIEDGEIDISILIN